MTQRINPTYLVRKCIIRIKEDLRWRYTREENEANRELIKYENECFQLYIEVDVNSSSQKQIFLQVLNLNETKIDFDGIFMNNIIVVLNW